MVRFVRIDPTVSGSNPPLARPSVERGESPAVCNSRRRNHEVRSHQKEGPRQCSISKKLLSVQMSTFDI